ncbi:alpha-galactosidase [Salipaludibacillus sp. HK11]|uniref:alpha-galactosidase n=1 Tax=Salipaludibacillus sp. HK11 TaxID=3394320 RepID=UPI0039FD2202
MPISYYSESCIFHLQTENSSYVLQLVKKKYLGHLYWGNKVNHYSGSNELRFRDRSFSPNPDTPDPYFSLDTLPQEYPTFGNTDFRLPAFQVQHENGSTVIDLQYESHQIFQGKRGLEGLPATYVESEKEAETLEITLYDKVSTLRVILVYSVFNEYDAIARSVRFENEGAKSLSLLKASSANVDFRDGDFQLITLPGAWARERDIQKVDLHRGVQSIESRRGTSSHQQNPFMALARKDVTETNGEVYGLNLVYSGNFQGSVEVDQFNYARINIGINPFDFSWLLEAGESFQTPEVVMVYSGEGLGKMSRIFHDLYRERLCRGEFRDKVRPVLINNWEATYFDFNEEKIKDIASVGKELGMELFVLDDGWFGKRNSDKGSLGDWFVDKNKLPKGIEHLGKEVTELDMEFGLWFEPEMISKNSDLYREHPDWCIHVPDRYRSEGRNQLILDLTRKEVRDEIASRLISILESAPITYVKWDMNRHMTETGSATLPKERQRETAHRYMLGVYELMEKITKKFPHILFESCSGGGGRFDPGILYYMPQTWTSDNTDAISRLRIQYGTSLVYPMSAMGSHVSDVPNHQVQRMTSLDIRGHVAMSGNLGYELDVTKFSAEDKFVISDQVKQYKKIREVIQFGDFHRLLSPFENDDTAWMYVSKDRSEAVVAYFQMFGEANAAYKKIRFRGLNKNELYKITELNKHYYGDELMNIGVNLPFLEGDFQSVMWTIKQV